MIYYNTQLYLKIGKAESSECNKALGGKNLPNYNLFLLAQPTEAEQRVDFVNCTYFYCKKTDLYIAKKSHIC